MFFVKIKVGKSEIHGLGLFADEHVKKGEKVYVANEKLDLFLHHWQFTKLGKNEQDTIRHYGYFDKRTAQWHLAFDDIRFCNHNKEGNITLKKGVLIAKKDISKGEEITQDYSEFENLREDLE